MRVLITGRTGQVGSELVRALENRVETHVPGRAGLDLSNPVSIRDSIRSIRPDLVINAAAYTAVDRAESEPDTAIAVNARAPAVFGEEAARAGFSIVHFSTDYVFDGARAKPYTEDDRAAPLSVYGRTKRLGDAALEASGASFLTLRVGWVYSGYPGNFLTTMLRLMSERTTLRVVADEIGAPTWSRHIARATIEALEAMAGPVEGWTRETLTDGLGARGGLYHLSPEGETSWHGFATEIHRVARRHGTFPLRVEEVVPIPASEWTAAARRPAYGKLSPERLKREIGVALPEWREGVAACLDDLARRTRVDVRVERPASRPRRGSATPETRLMARREGG
ncbi:MAG: dTDP-4-dehydrorhamnose reductase [Gemmatimonadota bacterium]|nr:dTDP-4-dehydrorhamnose reductase [Gemmatimonadota bacterium]